MNKIISKGEKRWFDWVAFTEFSKCIKQLILSIHNFVISKKKSSKIENLIFSLRNEAHLSPQSSRLLARGVLSMSELRGLTLGCNRLDSHFYRTLKAEGRLSKVGYLKFHRAYMWFRNTKPAAQRWLWSQKIIRRRSHYVISANLAVVKVVVHAKMFAAQTGRASSNVVTVVERWI